MFALKKLVLLVSLALGLSAGVVQATVYNVTNTADGNGLDQLRGALVDAGNNPGTHTVNVIAGTFYIDNGDIGIGTVNNSNITINGAGIGNTIIDARQNSRAFVLNPGNNRTGLKISFNGLTIQNCASFTHTGGGAIAAAGGVGNAYSFDNCLFYNNGAYYSTSAGSGGAIYSLDASLSISNCSFTSNTSQRGLGGAISFRYGIGSAGQLNISDSKFSFNTTPGEGGSGGAIFASVTGFSGTIALISMTGCTFSSNSAAQGFGGAMYISSSRKGSPVNINYNRFSGNTAMSQGAVIVGYFEFGNESAFPPNELLNVKNNWWGCNAGAEGCNDFGYSPNGIYADSFAAIFAPHLQLKTTISAPAICYPGTNSVQVSTGFTSNSANEPIDPANLGALIGRPVSFIIPGPMGNFSGMQTSIQANGKAVANFNSNGTPGIASIQAISESPSTIASLTVNTPGSWLGTSSTDWFSPANWCGGAVPTASTNVNIPASTPHSPVIELVFGGAYANNITIAAGAKLTLGNDAVLEVKGDFTNNGSYIANALGALTVFSGPGNQTIPGTDYEFLGIDGGGIKTLTSDATLNLQFAFWADAKMALGDNTLTFNTNTQAQNFNGARYFITNGTGGLKKKNIGAGGFTFPIGSETSYMPVVLSNSGTHDNFTARVGEGVYTSYVNNVPQGSPVANKAVNSTWYISEDVSGGSNATLSLYWNPADELTSFDRSNCYVAHYKNGSWNSITSGPASGSNPFFAKRSGITSFSPFTVTNPDSPLPVTLARFDAVKEGSTALLSWSTTEETNSDRFEVERSINGKVWQKIGTVKAQGESKVWADYRFTDQQPVPSLENLYRLKMIDWVVGTPVRDHQEGTFAYSRIRSLKFDDADAPIVFPNPAKDKLFVQDFTRVSSLRINDLNGHVVHQSGAMKNNEISVNKFTAGVHFVEIKWLDGRTTVRKIVINP